GATGGPVWKNTFEALEIVGFGGAVVYTSATPLTGGTHTHCSENRWINCRFANNLLCVYNQNCQAVNNTYCGCDFENFDTTYHGSPIT
ncbi:hypothetical protein, partial [Streptococcus pneumoniae]|uniref:hypothetical protein n=1 Tax=Streptococcus pneumoniae TaxID=1313 RepID=UPI001E5B4401